jgi:hypothetical protein
MKFFITIAAMFGLSFFYGFGDTLVSNESGFILLGAYFIKYGSMLAMYFTASYYWQIWIDDVPR